MKDFKRISAWILVLALAMLCGQALSENSIAVYVAKDGAKVYDQNGAVLAEMDLNDALSCTGVRGSVCRVEAQGRVGYMKKADLSRSPMGEAATAVAVAEPSRTIAAYVSTESATVYSAKGKALGKLSLNTQVAVTSVKGRV